MFGYHYTSYGNWLSVRSLGLRPYRIDRPELRAFFPDGVNAVWLWAADPQGPAHAGSVLYQVASKNDPRVVKLRCEFDEESVLTVSGRGVSVTHDGRLGGWQYHADEASILVLDRIPAHKIRLVGDYDVVKRLQ